MFAQLGLAMIVPVLVCIGLGSLAQRYLSFPTWTMLLFILVGVAGGINGMVRLLKMGMKMIKRPDPPKDHSDQEKKGE